jgi:hypothetical protein
MMHRRQLRADQCCASVPALTARRVAEHGWKIPRLVWFFIGMMVGAFLRDVRRMVFTLQLWPFTASITDWEKVTELTAREGVRAATGE